MCEVVLKSVLGELTLDAVIRAAGACACRISALDHESRDDTVEDQAVIEAFFYQTDFITSPFSIVIVTIGLDIIVFLLIFLRFFDKT